MKNKKKKLKHRKKENKKSIKKLFIKFILFCILITLISIIGFLAFKLFTFKELAKEMFNNTPSKVLDSNGAVIAEIGSERNRSNVKYSEVPDMLKYAYISIEDQRFYTHHGVDIKRTGGAILSYVTKRGSSSFGGSTITQQLVKNLTGDDSNTAFRKVKEWLCAWTLEICYSKEQILEPYLNIIYTGPNIYGVKEAAQFYFSKDLKDLSLAECAFIAGLNHSPNSYNPFTDNDRSEKIAKRTKIVINKMLELNYISQLQHDEAYQDIENGLKFKKGEIKNNSTIYSYHTDALVNEIITDFSKKKFITQDFASNYFSLAGVTIHSTQDTKIQQILETEGANNKYLLKSSNDSTKTSQAASVIIDQSTGYVVGCLGGLGKKNTSRGLNRATQMKRQTGSAMKPIAVLAPAIDKKLITNVTVFADEPTTFIDYNDENYAPVNYDNYLGSITLRRAVESSQNIPFVKIMEELTPQVAVKYLKKMGITTLNEKDVNLSLSLGGLDEGISPLEFAGAYATIANDGVYIEPTFYKDILSSSGKMILKSKQTKRRVFSKDVAYILKELLTEPVKRKQWDCYLLLYFWYGCCC